MAVEEASRRKVTECQERRLSAKPPRLAADTSDADELKVTATESVVGGAEQKLNWKNKFSSSGISAALVTCTVNSQKPSTRTFPFDVPLLLFSTV